VGERTALKNRIHATLMAFGYPCPVSDLFGATGRRLLEGLALLDTGLAARDGSSDRAWADLTAYRDALAARQAAAERGRPVRPHRRGHSSATATSPRRTSPRPRPKAGSACGVS
jgi:hypothetical protein